MDFNTLFAWVAPRGNCMGMTKPAPMDFRPTHEELLARLHYDPISGIFTHLKSGGRKRVGSVAGSTDKKGYVSIGIDGFIYFAHHLAWFYIHKEWPDRLDHRDRNGAHNAIGNLRLATNAQNIANRGVMGNSKTGVKGVSINRHGRYRVRLRINGKKVSFGSYETANEASAVYQREATRVHGEFA